MSYPLSEEELDDARKLAFEVCGRVSQSAVDRLRANGIPDPEEYTLARAVIGLGDLVAEQEYQVHREIGRLTARIAELEADAKRYRWLRERIGAAPADAAIDAAIAAGGEA